MRISSCLRKAVNGHAHWCPGCERMHLIPDDWSFNGNADRPTFSPSVKITYNGPDAGQFARGRQAPAACCHYFLTEGILRFCSDSTHARAGRDVPLPALPAEHLDPFA